MALYNFTIKLKHEDGWYTAQCEELPGAISQCKTLPEVVKNINEAIEGYIEAFPEEFEKIRSKLQIKNKVVEQKTILEIAI